MEDYTELLTEIRDLLKELVGNKQPKRVRKTVNLEEYKKSNMVYYEFVRDLIQYFHVKRIPSTDSDKVKWMSTIKTLVETDEHDIEELKKAIIFARTDEFWMKNFLVIPSLRTKNASGVMKIDSILSAMPDRKSNEPQIHY